MIPQYYGVHWGVYPANIIQQQGPGSQQRRPISPTQTNEVTSQSNGNLAASAAQGNMQGALSQYQVSAVKCMQKLQMYEWSFIAVCSYYK